LKENNQGIKLEINCRLNLALCKIKQNEPGVAIDQCERVLLEDNTNIKALYRLSMALNSQEHQLEAWPYIKKAYKQAPGDKAIGELYDTLKKFKDAHDAQNKKASGKEETGKDGVDQDNKNDSKKAKLLRSAFKFNQEKEREPESHERDSDQEDVKIEEEKVPTQYVNIYKFLG
jgi:tetratricopeptide (TPR) repeat protein